MESQAKTERAGLSAAEAEARLVRYGPNEVGTESGKRFFETLAEILTEPLLILLIAAAVIYGAIGDLAEGLLLCAFALLSISLLVYQARRSENALAALKALSAPVATVIRDGVRLKIAARDVVPGDLVCIDEGERIPADGVLVRSQALIVDESLLTGESVPVRKRADAAAGALTDTATGAADAPGGDDQPYVYAGTLGVGGHGIALITRTGARTLTGSIGASLESITIEPTRLQRSTARIVRMFGGAAFVVCIALIAWIGLVEGDWIKGALSGIALAMAMLPEEFPVALAVFLAIGAWRLSRVNVLARRPAVVETLGAATVLCVDKTGTLTENRMRVATLAVGDDEADLADLEAALEADPATDRLPDAMIGLIETAYLAARHASFDPMDSAVGRLAGSTVQEALSEYGDWPLVREYGITPELLAFSQAWRDDQGVLQVATKGAPEAIASLCHMSENERSAMMKRVGDMAERGLRVLGVAKARHAGSTVLDNPHDYNFEFAGLIGFEDPMRPTVPGAVAQAHRGGMVVKMITGDYPATAMAIAGQSGIDTSGGFLTGSDVAELSAVELQRAVAGKNVFARMMPEQKLRLVEALKSNGDVVAMTGDGVNDAPALKSAHIGIAMGERGTDVAREAAGIVLLNEDFGTIVNAVRMGRRIFENLRKVMIYIAAIHVPIAGLALLPLLFGMPPLLLPMHVVLIEMIIDPMCSVAFETTPEEKDIMEHPPRAMSDPMVGAEQLILGLVQGAVLLAVCLALYWRGLESGWSEDLARTLSLIALAAANIGLARVNASRSFAFSNLFARGYRLFWLIALIAASVVTLCIAIPQLRDLFGFSVPAPMQILAAIGIGLFAAAIPDLFKAVARFRAGAGGHGNGGCADAWRNRRPGEFAARPRHSRKSLRRHHLGGGFLEHIGRAAQR
jgi:Ca2+-transporting ATPase